MKFRRNFENRKEDTDDATTKKDEAKKEFRKLEPMRAEGEESHAERFTNRDKEIKAPKDAMAPTKIDVQMDACLFSYSDSSHLSQMPMQMGLKKK